MANRSYVQDVLDYIHSRPGETVTYEEIRAAIPRDSRENSFRQVISRAVGMDTRIQTLQRGGPWRYAGQADPTPRVKSAPVNARPGRPPTIPRRVAEPNNHYPFNRGDCMLIEFVGIMDKGPVWIDQETNVMYVVRNA